MSLQSSQTAIRKKIVVAMSGGVDSSVAAALLKRAGFLVVGVFMKFWHEAEQAENRCCSSESEKRARAVAASLGISFYVFNFEKEFKKRIVDRFLKDYKVVLTPNPCVVCNKEIKFGLLLEKARALGVDYVATGHYACLKNGRLFKAKDRDKDQSYFLWQLSQKQLGHILFPIGDYTKEEVRSLARKFRLPTAITPDSQEICFVPKTTNDFLAKHLKQKPGRIISTEGKILGSHPGLWFYTIGQRKGMGLAGGPLWVLDKDPKKNLLIVTKNERDLLKKELTFKNVNWIFGKEPKLPLQVAAKIRYRSKPVSAAITKTLNPQRYTLEFHRPQRAVTPGQSVVFYLPADSTFVATSAKEAARRAKEGRGRELLGGGIICDS